jgi:hypothetical protein
MSYCFHITTLLITVDRPFKVVSGSGGKPVVEVENGSNKQQFVWFIVMPPVQNLTLI